MKKILLCAMLATAVMPNADAAIGDKVRMETDNVAVTVLGGDYRENVNEAYAYIAAWGNFFKTLATQTTDKALKAALTKAGNDFLKVAMFLSKIASRSKIKGIGDTINFRYNQAKKPIDALPDDINALKANSAFWNTWGPLIVLMIRQVNQDLAALKPQRSTNKNADVLFDSVSHLKLKISEINNSLSGESTQASNSFDTLIGRIIVDLSGFESSMDALKVVPTYSANKKDLQTCVTNSKAIVAYLSLLFSKGMSVSATRQIKNANVALPKLFTALSALKDKPFWKVYGPYITRTLGEIQTNLNNSMSYAEIEASKFKAPSATTGKSTLAQKRAATNATKAATQAKTNLADLKTFSADWSKHASSLGLSATATAVVATETPAATPVVTTTTNAPATKTTTTTPAIPAATPATTVTPVTPTATQTPVTSSRNKANERRKRR